jgi:hypothetical protein
MIQQINHSQFEGDAVARRRTRGRPGQHLRGENSKNVAEDHRRKHILPFAFDEDSLCRDFLTGAAAF